MSPEPKTDATSATQIETQLGRQLLNLMSLRNTPAVAAQQKTLFDVSFPPHSSHQPTNKKAGRIAPAGLFYSVIPGEGRGLVPVSLALAA